MSAWTHDLCNDCYGKLEPGRVPHRLIADDPAVCCSCGGVTDSPIPYRGDPSAFRCGGVHEEEANDEG